MLLLLCVLSASAAFAGESVTVSHRLGFGGIVPIDKPAPLTILVENLTSKPVTIVAKFKEDANYTQNKAIEHKFQVSPSVGKQFTFLVHGNNNMRGTLSFTADHKVFWTSKTTTSTTEEETESFVDYVGNSPTVRESAAPIVVIGGRARQVVSALGGGHRGDSRPEGLSTDARDMWFCELEQAYAPDNQLAWSGVPVVIWTEPDATKFSDPVQFEALKRWVSCGGRLVILSATQPRALSAPELKSLLPVKVSGVKPKVKYPSVPQSARIIETHSSGVHFHFNKYNSADDELQGWLADATGPLLISDTSGFALAAPEGTNWDVLGSYGWEKQYGTGSVRVLAFDPLVYDRGVEYTLLQAIAVGAGLNFDTAEGYDYAYGEDDDYDYGYGYNHEDSARRSFYEMLVNNNVLYISVGPFVFLTILFLVLIGPGDYYILKRIRKLRYSAFTLIGYAILFSGAAVVATYFLFAPSPQTNRISFIDFTELEDGSEFASGYVIHGNYRPLGDFYSCDIEGAQVFGTRIDKVEAVANGEYAGPGRQLLTVDQPFNSFRQTGTCFVGQPAGTINTRFVEDDGRLFLEVTNGLDAPIYGMLICGQLAIDISTIDVGETGRSEVNLSSGLAVCRGSS